MAARRLPSRADPAPNPPRRRVRVTFDGKAFEAFEGEPLAVALLAAGRPILSRSFRFHRPRGLCAAPASAAGANARSTAGRASGRARSPSATGLVARGEHAWPSVGRDLFGWLTSARAGSRRPSITIGSCGRGRSASGTSTSSAGSVVAGGWGRGAVATGARGSLGSWRSMSWSSAAGGRAWPRPRRRQGAVSASRSSRLSPGGHDPRTRTSASSMALQPSAGMTASSRRSMTRRSGRSALDRSSRRPGRMSGCRRSAALTGRA